MKKRAITILCFVFCFCALFSISVSAASLEVFPLSNRVNLVYRDSDGEVLSQNSLVPDHQSDIYFFFTSYNTYIESSAEIWLYPNATGNYGISETGVYDVNFSFLSWRPFDENQSRSAPTVYLDLVYYDEALGSDESIRYITPLSTDYQGVFDDVGDYYSLVNVSSSFLGVDLLNFVLRNVPTTSIDTVDLRISNFALIDRWNKLDIEIYKFGFSQTWGIKETDSSEASLEIQREIAGKLDDLNGTITGIGNQISNSVQDGFDEQNNYQTGIDTNTPNNDFNNASDDYGQLEDSIYSQIDEDSVSDVIGSGEGVFTDLAQYASTLGLVSMCFGVFVGLPGISLYVILCLTFIVAGIFLNNRYRGNGNSDRNYQSRESRDKK